MIDTLNVVAGTYRGIDHFRWRLGVEPNIALPTTTQNAPIV